MIAFLIENSLIVELIFTVVSFLVSIMIAVNHAKKAKNSANADVNIIFEVIKNMGVAETALSPLKSLIGANVGAMKKDEVMTKIQNYCLSNGIAYDSEKVSSIVENLIEFSKKVNSKNQGVN